MNTPQINLTEIARRNPSIDVAQVAQRERAFRELLARGVIERTGYRVGHGLAGSRDVLIRATTRTTHRAAQISDEKQ
jgi:hypothetical protein